jgi:hypothetical protein
MEYQEREMLIQKIREWQKKSKQEKDPFNKYISICISYNIFYNLFAKTKDPSVDLTNGDSKRAVNTIELIIDADKLFKILQPDLEKYLQIIPAYREEHWQKIPITKELKQAYKENNAKKTIDLLLKWLYKVRCNLVHGDKGYQDDQQKMILEKSNLLLGVLLENLLEIYLRRYCL